MKRIDYSVAIALVTIISLLCLGTGCGTDGERGTDSTKIKDSIQKQNQEDLPLNISVYLDLSDRLTRPLNGPNQSDRDTAIINHIVDKIIEHAQDLKIVKCKDNFQIFFYPTPNITSISTIAKNLHFDFSNVDKKDKKRMMIDMKNNVEKGVSAIYNEALQAGNWEGSDIWGFFSNKKVDEYCIRKGYRNIIIILTDGYIFHQNNKQKEGDAYSYILPQTLANPNSSLLVKRNGLTDLEVMVLEVNPYEDKQRDLIEEKLKNWFEGMGITNGKFVMADTDLPSNTEHVIDNFLKSKN